jgi:hypothetical protein
VAVTHCVSDQSGLRSNLQWKHDGTRRWLLLTYHTLQSEPQPVQEQTRFALVFTKRNMGMRIPSEVYERVKLENPSEQIRLLKVYPTTSDHGAPSKISCELKVVWLREALDFAAVSYTWKHALYPEQSQDADSEDMRLITCNGVRCRILENLDDALLQFRQQPDQLLWVDAICIDQASPKEKTEQVQLMSFIYQAATKVFIWLGKHDDDVNNAVNLIKHLALLENDELATIHVDNLESDRVRTLLDDKYHHRTYWLSLARFLRRTWFTRAWVVQEVILAQADGISVFCGKRTLKWPDLRVVSGYLSSSAWRRTFADSHFLSDGRQPPRLGAAAKIGGTQDDIAVMTTASFSGEPHDLFLDTLIRVREFDCHHRRDKAYCCYGIGMRFRPRDFPFPKPDYDSRITDADAFSQTARAVLQMSQGLHLLAYAESLRSDDLEGRDTMPSWVPDWSIKKKVGLGITGYRRYHAAGNLTQIVEFADPPQRVLRVRAARVEIVECVGNTKEELALGHDLQSTEEILYRMQDDYKVGISGDTQTREEVLWRTLVHDTCPGTRCPADPAIGAQFRPWLHAHRGSIITTTLDHLAQATAGGNLNQSPLGSTVTNPIRQTNEFGNNYALRTCLRVFCTKSGLLGLGAEAVKPGDTIWIVPGSRVPLLMRNAFAVTNNASSQLPNRHQLVGAAYVHGLMYSEAMNRDPPLNFQTIVNIV